jgi:hypothetical protein
MTDAQQPAPDADRGSSMDGPPGLPRWVKISGIVVAILVAALFVAMLLGVNHGPGRHNFGAPSVGDGSPSVRIRASGSVPVWG